MKLILPTLLSVILIQASVAQQAGQFDLSFGTDGMIMTSVDSPSQGQNLEKLLWTEDDKILAIGWHHNSFDDPDYADLSIVRYYESGQRDSAFGNNGIARHNLGHENDMGDFIRSGIIQNDGKIVCVGGTQDVEGLAQIVIVRLLSDGSIDSSFAVNGIATFNPSNNGDEATSVQLQTDGKILVGYNSSAINCGIIRLHSNGSLDLSYGADGFAFVDHAVQDIVIQNDGKLIATGEYNPVSPYLWSMGVTRFDENGNLDLGFGTDGFTYFDHTNLNDPDLWTTWVRSIALQDDGKIIIGGACENQSSSYHEIFALGRLLPDGELDPSFGTDGRALVDLPTDFERMTKVIIQPDGKLLLSGYTAESKMIIARTHHNAVLDSSFNGVGYLMFDFGNGLSYANTAMLQPDLKLLVGGPANNAQGNYNFAIARILTDLNIGIVDLTTSVSNTLVYPNPIEEQARLQFELAQSEELTISLVDMQGRLVQTFINEQEMNEGKHDLQLQFENNLKSGTYLLSIASVKGQMGIRVIKR